MMLSSRKFFSTIALSTFLFSKVMAGVIPGAIPLTLINRPATDVVYQGRVQTPDELVQLRKQGVDLSNLNPIETSDLWKNTISASVNPALDQLPVQMAAPFLYLADVSSRLGVYRFSVQQTDAQGNVRVFTLLLGKSSHTYLLRKALLRKLGYQIPSILYAPKLTVHFGGEFSKSTFLKQIEQQAVADPARWVTNLADKDSLDVDLQDVLVFSANETMYNLATGFVPDDVIQGRRLLNSLIVPYGLTDMPGTLNALAWKAGRIVDNSFYMNFDGAEEFSTPVEDAVWIGKRLQKLTRQDYVDIARETCLPGPVQDLLVEKLIARTGSFLDAFKIAGNRLSFNANITEGSDLVGGVLKKTAWPGYGSLFASPNPPISPLSNEEITSFFKIKIKDAVLNSLVNTFNSKILQNTDINKKVLQEQINASQKQFEKFLQTGKLSKVPFGWFAFPTVDADFYVSRDIVIGQYLGTDNVIQLADSLQVSAAVGVFVGAKGLPADEALSLQNGVKLSRTYTHLKPTLSVKSATTEPFHNLLVQEVIKNKGHLFDELLSEDFQKASPEDQQKKLVDVLADFDKNMQKGESFIITDSLSANTSVSPTLSLSASLQLQPTFFAQKFVLHRLHILKADDQTLHVYQDNGDGVLRGLGIALSTYNLPLLSFDYQKVTGHAATNFYKINIKQDPTNNPDLVSNLLAVRQVFERADLELLNANIKPIYIQHAFQTKEVDASVLWYDSTTLATMDEIKIFNDKHESRDFVTASKGARSGPDFQGFTVNAINALIDKQYNNKDLLIPNPSSGDPGDSFKGHSFTRNVSLEVEKGSDGSIAQPFLNIHYNWKGWNATPKKMKSITDQINQKFGGNIFSKLDLYGTKEFQLYSINLNVSIYEKAIEDLLALDSRSLEQFLSSHGVFPTAFRGGDSYETWQEKNDRRKKIVVRSILDSKDEALLALQDHDFTKASQAAVEYLGGLEQYLPFPEFIKLVGSWDNTFVQGQFLGFRAQQENGDLPIISDSLGRVGSDLVKGGLDQLQRNIGISKAEFLGYWLMKNLE